MICPYCGKEIQELWQPFVIITDGGSKPLIEPGRKIETTVKIEKFSYSHIKVSSYWSICESCKRVMIKIMQTTFEIGQDSPSKNTLAKAPSKTVTWLGRPNEKASPIISDLVPPQIAIDFKEAYLICDDSPRMSAVLSRRILADLLDTYAGLKHRQLVDRINAFVNNSDHPKRHRDNMHYLREIGNFSAHTITDKGGDIIDIGTKEAEWTLKIIQDLFDYFIVEPKRDEEIRARIDSKVKKSGRNPIQIKL